MLSWNKGAQSVPSTCPIPFHYQHQPEMLIWAWMAHCFHAFYATFLTYHINVAAEIESLPPGQQFSTFYFNTLPWYFLLLSIVSEHCNHTFLLLGFLGVFGGNLYILTVSRAYLRCSFFSFLWGPANSRLTFDSSKGSSSMQSCWLDIFAHFWPFSVNELAV